MGVGVDAHHAAEVERALMPAPIQIEPPRIGVDLDGDAVLGTGGENFFHIDLVAGPAQELTPRHVAKDSGVRIGDRADDSSGLFFAVHLEAAVHARDHEIEAVPTVASPFSAIGILIAVGEIRHMDGACFQHRPTGYPVTVERLRLTKGKSEGSGVCTGHHEVAIAKEDGGVQREMRSQRDAWQGVAERLALSAQATGAGAVCNDAVAVVALDGVGRSPDQQLDEVQLLSDALLYRPHGLGQCRAPRAQAARRRGRCAH